MTSSNKKPANWPEALAMADDVEAVANLALTRILALVGGRRPIETDKGPTPCSPERITREIMGRERRIHEAVRLLELGDVDGALTVLRGG